MSGAVNRATVARAAFMLTRLEREARKLKREITDDEIALLGDELTHASVLIALEVMREMKREGVAFALIFGSGE